MKKYIVKFICIIFVLNFIGNVIEAKANVNLNNFKFFLRICEKYDSENINEWEKIIKERDNILMYVKNNDKYEEYNKYMNKNKKLIRTKRKYINKLNYSIEKINKYKIKRYLKIFLNIFDEENKELQKYFNIN